MCIKLWRLFTETGCFSRNNYISFSREYFEASRSLITSLNSQTYEKNWCFKWTVSCIIFVISAPKALMKSKEGEQSQNILNYKMLLKRVCNA